MTYCAIIDNVTPFHGRVFRDFRNTVVDVIPGRWRKMIIKPIERRPQNRSTRHTPLSSEEGQSTVTVNTYRKFVTSGHVVLETCERTEKQTDRQTCRHARNTSHPYRGDVINRQTDSGGENRTRAKSSGGD